MAKRIVLAVALALVILACVIVTRPNDFTVARRTTIAAAPAVIFPMVNDFHNWAAWSPWEGLDPKMQRTYSGAAAGRGAAYAWAGNDKVGEGKMTILRSKPDAEIQIQLEFIKPWQANNDTTFTFQPQGAGTLVTWRMSGSNTLMTKAISLFMPMDKMIGPDFEKGLATMKTKAEAAKK